MPFTPAAAPPTTATTQQWCLAFVGTQLLVAADAPTDMPLAPTAAQDWQASEIGRAHV